MTTLARNFANHTLCNHPLLYSILYDTKLYMEFNFMVLQLEAKIKVHKPDGSLLYITMTSRMKLGFHKIKIPLTYIIIQAI